MLTKLNLITHVKNSTYFKSFARTRQAGWSNLPNDDEFYAGDGSGTPSFWYHSRQRDW
ncbi:MAG: hypothetical protein DHS20C17_06290 [Cyclobacteriaceae bacterium]|nr:MAG: hypothetical protein DHS20C17_06290 [Cyclobacteriaceae bacterium]